jgi:hypothetical protein
MRKTRTRETVAAEARAYARACKAGASPRASEAHAAAHSAEMRSSSHAAEMPAASHPATMAPTAAATMPTTTTAAAAAAAASKRRGRQSKGRTKRAHDEATKDLVVHPDYSVLNRSDGHRRKKKTVRRAKLSNDFK